MNVASFSTGPASTPADRVAIESPHSQGQSKSQAMATPSSGPPRTREPSAPHPLTTVVQLGMSLTEFFTSSSVTSTTLQCSSSEGRGSSPFLVTQGCNCRSEGRQRSGPQTDRHPVSKEPQTFHQPLLCGPKPTNPKPKPNTHTSWGRAVQEKLRPACCVPAQPSLRPLVPSP